jgi:hypothetical protein
MYLKKTIMIITYKQKLKKVAFWLSIVLVAGATGCKKGTFDINSPNPNSPSPATVPAKYYLSSSLAGTANIMYTGGNGAFYGGDLLNTWMGYWSASGGYTPSPIVVLYQLTNGVGTGNWDDAYINIKNYSVMETLSKADSTQTNYGAISIIMQAFMYQRIVDLYNNAPYTNALSTSNTTPAYDLGSDIYNKNLSNIDSAIKLIKTAETESFVENPGSYDVMFKGKMDMWIKFANTLKLKMVMRLTQTSTGATIIANELSGLTASDFLGAGEDASVNPGYSTASNAQENPLFLDISLTASGSPGTNFVYWRANSYAVNYYAANKDPRINFFYVPAQTTGTIVGRDIGSTSGTEGNGNVSAVNGPGVAKAASQSAPIIPAFESLFLQAEASQRNFITGTAGDLYRAGVEASFQLLGAKYDTVFSKVDPTVDSITYTPTQTADIYMDSVEKTNPLVNWGAATDKVKLIITQKWAASNTFDPLESFSDWRRSGIPSNLAVSNYPGSQAAHIPYRFDYPTSETSYNAASVGAQGTIDALTSKIFWQP